MSRLTSPALERVKAVLLGGPALRLAVLFGSQASGKARADSDADIAIWPVDGELSLAAELRLAGELSGATGTEIDLIRLDRDDPILAHQVALQGLALVEEKPGAFSAFRARAISAWLDHEVTFGPHRARFLARLARQSA